MQEEEKEGKEYRCALVGRRSIPLMKYIVKFREEDGEGEKEGVSNERERKGTVRKVAASKPNERKRERKKRRENEEEGETGG